MIVKATREGLEGHETSVGFKIDAVMPFVALPSRDALYKFVHITNLVNGKTCIAIVLDVGPWNEHDDDYVFGGHRPAAERGISKSMKGTNNSGIDLSDVVWKALGMIGNTDVNWEFLV